MQLYFFFFLCIQRYYYCNKPSTIVPLQRQTPQRYRRYRHNKKHYTIFILQPITHLASFSPPSPQAANRSICKAFSLPLYSFVNAVDDVVLIPSALQPPHTIHLLISLLCKLVYPNVISSLSPQLVQRITLIQSRPNLTNQNLDTSRNSRPFK